MNTKNRYAPLIKKRRKRRKPGPSYIRKMSISSSSSSIHYLCNKMRRMKIGLPEPNDVLFLALYNIDLDYKEDVRKALLKSLYKVEYEYDREILLESLEKI